MISLLVNILRTFDMHFVTSQRTINGTGSIKGQTIPVHQRFFANAMPKTYTMTLPANSIRVGNKLLLGGRKNKPSPQFILGSNMAK